MRIRLPASLLLLFLVSCGGAEESAEPATPFTYYDANAEASRDAQAALDAEAAADAAELEAQRAGKAPGLSFRSITLEPERVTIEGVLKAKAKLSDGVSPFTEVEYVWSVNGRTVLGVSKGELTAATGRFRKGDRVSVRAEAMDERGQIATIEATEIEIANSIPVILNDISRRPGIDGLRMEGEDADGDEITWSILSGPPGITMNARGVVEVKPQDLDEAFDGEVVIAGTDPDGARAELHVPVAINAAVEEVIGEKTTTATHHRDSMTDEEYTKLNLDNAERVMDMSEDEFKAHWAEQERREEERKKELERK